MYGIFVSHDRIFELLRQIAKKDYWQILYGQAKELNGLAVFINNTNHTYFQVYFLNQLAFYSSLHLDIATGDVSELVMDNEIYENAYAYYKRQKLNPKKHTKQEKVVESKPLEEKVLNKNQWVFTKVKGKQ